MNMAVLYNTIQKFGVGKIFLCSFNVFVYVNKAEIIN